MADRYVPRERFLDQAGQMAWAWWRYLSDLREVPLWRGQIGLTTQAASIAATSLLTRNVTQRGIFRVSYYTRVIRAATTSSELTITIAWTDGGVAQTRSGDLLNGNTTTTRQDGVWIIRADKNTAINYSTAYASVGATTMQYSLDLMVEQLV